MTTQCLLVLLVAFLLALECVSVQNRAVKIISAGATKTCAVLDVGALKCWGVISREKYGGRAETMGNSLVSVMEANVTDAAISDLPGYTYDFRPQTALCIIHSGRVKCSFFMFDMIVLDFGTSTQISRLFGGGRQSFCGLDQDKRSLFCWNMHGISSQEDADAARVHIGVDEDIEAVVLSFSDKCVIFSSRRVKCWGENFAQDPESSPFLLDSQGDPIMARSITLKQSTNEVTYVDFAVNETRVAASAETYPFHDIPSFGKPVKIFESGDILCAISDTGKLACGSSQSGGFLGTGTMVPMGVSDLIAPINLGTGIDAVEVVFAITSKTICVLTSVQDVRCFGSNQDGILGVGVQDAGVIVGDEADEMGDHLQPVLLSGCGFGSFEVPSVEPQISSLSPGSLFQELSPAHAVCEADFSGVARNITMTLETSNETGNLYEYSLGTIDESVASASSEDLAASCEDYSESPILPEWQVYSFVTNITGLYAISAEVVFAESLRAPTLSLWRCNSEELSCSNLNYQGNGLKAELFKGVMYRIKFSGVDHFTVTKLTIRVGGFEVWPADSQFSTAVEMGELRASPFSKLGPLDNDGRTDLVERTILFIPPTKAYYRFNDSYHGPASQLVIKAGDRVSTILATSPRYDDYRFTGARTVSHLLFPGERYLISAYYIEVQNSDVSALSFTASETSRYSAGYLCQSCPSDGVVGQSTAGYAAASSVEDCVRGVFAEPYTASLKAVAGTLSSIKVRVVNEGLFDTMIGLSAQATPSFVQDVWVFDNTDPQVALVNSKGYRLDSGSELTLEITLVPDRMELVKEIIDVVMPILWWPVGTSTSAESDLNKNGLSIKFSVLLEPNADVSPRKFSFVLEKNKRHLVEQLESPLAFRVFSATSTSMFTGYRFTRGCKDERSNNPLQFLYWGPGTTIIQNGGVVDNSGSYEWAIFPDGTISTNHISPDYVDFRDVTFKPDCGLNGNFETWDGQQLHCMVVDPFAPIRKEISRGTNHFFVTSPVSANFTLRVTGDHVTKVYHIHDQSMDTFLDGYRSFGTQVARYVDENAVPSGFCANGSGEIYCREQYVLKAVANHVYLVAIEFTGDAANLVVEFERTSPIQLANLLIAERVSYCLTVHMIIGKKTAGLSEDQARHKSFLVEMNFVFTSPCPPGTSSLTGSNEFGCIPCALGSYQSNSGQTSCQPCPSDFLLTRFLGSTSVQACETAPGKFRDSFNRAAICPRGGNCSDAGLTLQTLRLQPGFWRTSSNSSEIFSCMHKQYCRGGHFGISEDNRRLSDENNALCAPNHHGIMCEACTPGLYKQGVLRMCETCSTEQTSADRMRIGGYIAGLMLVVLFVLVATSVGFVRAMKSSSEKGKDDLFFALVDIGTKLRVLVGLFQVLGNMSLTFEVVLPEFFEGLARLAAILAFDLMEIFDLGCAFESSNYFSSMLAALLAPIVVSVMILLVHAVMVELRKSKLSLDELTYRRNVSFTMFLLLLFLIYPTVSQRTLSLFHCISFDDGSYVLAVDPSISCNSSEYGSFYGVAILMVLLYVVGIPLLQFVLLFRKRASLVKESTSDDGGDNATKHARDYDPRMGDRSIEYLRFLWRPYEARCFYFEIVESFRKLLQTSTLVFVGSGTSLQMIYQAVITIGFATLFQYLLPYRYPSNNMLAILSLWTIFFITFISLLIKLDMDNLEYDVEVLNAVLIVLVFLVPIVFVFQIVDEFSLIGKTRRCCVSLEDRRVQFMQRIQPAQQQLSSPAVLDATEDDVPKS